MPTSPHELSGPGLLKYGGEKPAWPGPMTPGARRDLVIGGAVVAVGVGLFGFAIFGDDDGFRAPRWVVAAGALSFIASGVIPLRGRFFAGDFILTGTYPNAAASAVLAVLALAAVWMMIAVGPE